MKPVQPLQSLRINRTLKAYLTLATKLELA